MSYYIKSEPFYLRRIPEINCFLDEKDIHEDIEDIEARYFPKTGKVEFPVVFEGATYKTVTVGSKKLAQEFVHSGEYDAIMSFHLKELHKYIIRSKIDKLISQGIEGYE